MSDTGRVAMHALCLAGKLMLLMSLLLLLLAYMLWFLCPWSLCLLLLRQSLICCLGLLGRPPLLPLLL
jgi:hypothetical protein